MQCPKCYGTGKELVEVVTDKGTAWDKADCGCDGGYVSSPNNGELALSAPASGPTDQELDPGEGR